ncbi:MAG: dihydrofolate reductase family protein [Acidimicrobiia bacterium]
MELKAHSTGDLLVGGADLAAEFLRLDLIDGLDLLIHPVVLGAGKPLFHGLEERIEFDLIDTHVFGNGVVMLRYRGAGLQPFE